MTSLTIDHAANIAAAILAARDFCGDENAAIGDYLADTPISGPPARRRALVEDARRRADAEWQRCRAAAGVRADGDRA